MNSEEEAKANAYIYKLERYWRFALPLTFVLALMVKFPLRIALRELFYDGLFYGTISLICVEVAMQVYRRFGRPGYRLIAVFLLCSALSGWQVFDLLILRTNTPSVLDFGPGMSQYFTDQDGLAWYELRFPNSKILCHSLYEQYFGNQLIAITVRINREATWFACGG